MLKIKNVIKPKLKIKINKCKYYKWLYMNLNILIMKSR